MSFNFIFYSMPFGIVLTAYLLGISIILISPWLGVLAIIVIPWFARYASQNISMLFFAPESGTVSKSHINDASIVFKLIYGETLFLFTGDMESNGEASLLHFDSQLDADVLKVGHHGSKTSSTDPFIKLVSHELTVVPVEYKNKFQHPSEAVLERIKQHTDRIHRTDQSGALRLRSNGKYIKEIHWK